MNSGVRQSSSARVVLALRERIARGEFAPGARLRESALAGELGVSRNTLREAFAALTRERLLSHEPHRGVCVAILQSDDVRAIYAQRLITEPGALLWGGSLDVVGLDSIVARGERARRSHDVHAMAGANQDFHAAIVAGSESGRLREDMSQILAEMRLIFARMGHDPRFHEPYVRRNREIVTLLSAQPPFDGARESPSESARRAAADYLHTYLAQARDQLVVALNALDGYVGA